MIVNTVMIVLCTAAVAFYARFLMALCKESRSRSTGYWVRLRLSPPEDAIAELQARKKPVPRRKHGSQSCRDKRTMYDLWW
jgi:hypothetical protein